MERGGERREGCFISASPQGVVTCMFPVEAFVIGMKSSEYLF